MAEHKVRLHNAGRAARVFYDGEIPVRVGAGETVEATLSEETIARLKAAREDNPDEPPPLEVTQLSPASDAKLGEASGTDPNGHEHEAGRSGHKRRPPPTG